MTHLHRKADLEKAQKSGIEAYNAEQIEKTEILNILLSGYNAGRQKTMFCVAVNLLDLQELREVLKEIEKRQGDLETWTLKEKSVFVVGLLQEEAAKKNIDLKLRKKKKGLESFQIETALWQDKPLKFRDKDFKKDRYTAFADDHSF